ncbi:hypothetical protein ACFLST_00030 [Chloroflexota bacterium]
MGFECPVCDKISRSATARKVHLGKHVTDQDLLDLVKRVTKQDPCDQVTAQVADRSPTGHRPVTDRWETGQSTVNNPSSTGTDLNPDRSNHMPLSNIPVAKKDEPMPDKEEVKGLIKDLLAEEKAAEKQQQKEADLVSAIQSIGQRFDQMDSKVTDLCDQFPELCQRVENVEQAVSTSVEEGSPEWKQSRKRDLSHLFFEDCPNCNPVREELLEEKGKVITDKPMETAPSDKVGDKIEEKVEDLPRTSDEPRKGYRWDYFERTYVRRE